MDLSPERACLSGSMDKSMKAVAMDADVVASSKEQNGENLYSREQDNLVATYEHKIKLLQEQVLRANRNLRNVLYNVLPALCFNNVPLYKEHALQQEVTMTVGQSPVDYARGGARTNDKFELFDVIPGSESPDRGVVFRGAMQLEGDRPCLVKEIALDNKLDARFVESLHQEIGLLHGLRHDCIARIIHVERYPRLLHVFYDVDVGMVKLSDAITQIDHYNDILYVARTFRCIMSAIIFCHDKRYAHLDVCPSNILVRPQNCSAILTGFEFCRPLSPNSMEVEQRKIVHTVHDESFRQRGADEESLCSSECRTNRSPWSSPEIYFNMGDGAGASSDVFSAAVVLLDILLKKSTGFKYPDDDSYVHSKKVKRALPSGWTFSAQSKIKVILSKISELKPVPLGADALKEMLGKMLNLNAQDRISARDVIRDVWVRGIMVAAQNSHRSKGLNSSYRRNDNSPPPPLTKYCQDSKRLTSFSDLSKNDRTWNALHLPPLDRFVRASNYVHHHRMLFTSEEALELYGLWMQSTEGPASRFGTPFKNDYRERRKWDAWRSHKMKPQISAMLEYVSYLNAIIDSRISDGASTTNPRSIDATHMGLSVSRAKPKAREVDKAHISKNPSSRFAVKQHRPGSYTPGISSRSRPSTASRSSSFKTEVHASAAQNGEIAKFDKLALVELQQSRPTTAPVYDSPENLVKGSSEPSGTLMGYNRKALKRYEFLSNLSPSRLYDHTTNGHIANVEQSSASRKNISNQIASPISTEKYRKNGGTFGITGRTPSDLAHSGSSSSPLVVKIDEKTFYGDHELDGNTSKSKRLKRAPLPHINGLARDLNNGELSGW